MKILGKYIHGFAALASAAALFAAASAVALSTVGCGINGHELPKECILDIEVDYTFDPPGEALLPTMVGNIEVYVFDRSSGVLTDILYIGKSDIERGRISANLSPGNYRFVCWATGGDKITTGGYFPVHMTNPASTAYTDIAIGTTSYSEFRMMLDCNELPADIIGEVAPKMINFDDLFFSMADSVRIDGRSNVIVPFHFICDTSVLRVRIGGLDVLRTRMSGSTRADDGLPDVFVTAPHERYNHDNTLAAYARNVRFELPTEYVAADTMVVDIKVQRLEYDSDDDRSVLLYVQDPSTGADMIEPIDVVAKIRSIVDTTTGELLFTDQNDLDKQYDFDITINFTDEGVTDPSDIRVTITINEYVVHDNTSVKV